MKNLKKLHQVISLITLVGMSASSLAMSTETTQESIENNDVLRINTSANVVNILNEGAATLVVQHRTQDCATLALSGERTSVLASGEAVNLALQSGEPQRLFAFEISIDEESGDEASFELSQQDIPDNANDNCAGVDVDEVEEGDEDEQALNQLEDDLEDLLTELLNSLNALSDDNLNENDLNQAIQNLRADTIAQANQLVAAANNIDPNELNQLLADTVNDIDAIVKAFEGQQQDLVEEEKVEDDIDANVAQEQLEDDLNTLLSELVDDLNALLDDDLNENELNQSIQDLRAAALGALNVLANDAQGVDPNVVNQLLADAVNDADDLVKRFEEAL